MRKNIKKTKKEIFLIRSLYKNGLSYSQIEKRVSCCKRTICLYCADIVGNRDVGRKKGELYGSPPWNKGKEFTKMLGNKYAFIGDKAKKGTGQMRAYVKFKGVTTCNRCKITPKSSFQMIRHHRDENTLNNKKSNIEFLCRRCHINHHRKALLEARKLKLKQS